MATEKQILANRRNARSSTGPRTTTGKASSRMNARRHGLAAHLEDAVPETCLELDELSDRLSKIENERLQLHQAIEQALKEQDVHQVTKMLHRLSALDRYVRRCSSTLRKR